MALAKLRAEMEQNQNNRYVQTVGKFLVDFIRRNPGAEANIMAEGKTIKGSLAAMKEEARKNQVDGVGMLTDEEGFAVVLKYYGIDAAPKAASRGLDVSLDDLV